MKAFVAVADGGHFAMASERLGLSRAMASKLVMDLEAHLGLRLLNRTTRKVSLTEPGAAYLERCRDILAAIEEAEREIAAQASEPVGRLRVTAPMSFGALHVAPRIAALHRALFAREYRSRFERPARRSRRGRLRSGHTHRPPRR